MHYVITDRLPNSPDESTIYLLNSNWDDWFEFETLYIVYYSDENCIRELLGSIKIGRIGQTERRVSLPLQFEALPENFFSLGTDINYYRNLRRLKDLRIKILTDLHDIAYNKTLYEKVKNQHVTRISLLRDITESMVKGQFHRVADGGATLTNYEFTYTLPSMNIYNTDYLKLDFKIDASQNIPPTNIHVLIGKNGIGKTTILKRMIFSLISDKPFEEVGSFETGWGETFSNVVNISFSVFDTPILMSDINSPKIPYQYVGLIKPLLSLDGGKSMALQNKKQLTESFLSTYVNIQLSPQKKILWERAINVLMSDYTFKDLDILHWWPKDDIIDLENKWINSPISKELSKSDFVENVKKHCEKCLYEKFRDLSSGHKNILLTIVNLIDLVEEKTLVILDEPEEHLHPPLVSAFIRSLSDLLTYRNGVAIIATHSPVIIQEVPRKCVWIIRGSGNQRVVEHPQIETFGENLGELTSEVFGYEVMNSGFHKMILDVSEKKCTYEATINVFNNELGNEAKSILKSYTYKKE